ncbi:MAG: hypothetical protein K8R21_11455, partial [Leptospira sp.]|nr:hypothetical protein [Leptospira sp.]
MQKHKTIILTITLGMLLIPHTCITSETNPVDPKIKPELAVLGNDTMSFIRAGKWKQTEALLKQIYKVSGESLEYFYLKGAYLYSRGNFQEAKKNIDKALEKNHMHDPSNYVSGMIHTRFRNYDVASEFFERAAQSGTYNPFYRMNFAVSLFLKGDYAKAKVEFEKTIELKSNFSDAKICLLRTLVRSDKKKEALQFSSKLIEEKIISEETREIYSRMIFELNNDYFGAIKTLSGLKNISL